MTPPNDELNQFIEKFIDQVIKDLKIAEITPEMDKNLRALVKERVEKRLMATVIESLADEEIDKLMEKIDKAGITENEEVEAFAEAVKKIPNFPEKVREALTQLHKELTEDAAELKKYSSGSAS